MSCWQYAQLTITVDGRDPHGARTILWHGPGQGIGENYSDSGHTVLELLNRFGADGWELAGLQDYREGGDGSSYWEGLGCSRCTPSNVRSLLALRPGLNGTTMFRGDCYGLRFGSPSGLDVRLGCPSELCAWIAGKSERRSARRALRPRLAPSASGRRQLISPVSAAGQARPGLPSVCPAGA